tara:strand:+ start:1501 stop:1761 length:261 start_codon:yes stop_codon:yes gene_type:complete
MYGRIISFTLLAPSLWSVVESIGSKQSSENHKRFLFKSADNAGFIVEIFSDRKIAGSNLETMKAMQGLREQAMAKVNVSEGEGLSS